MLSRPQRPYRIVAPEQVEQGAWRRTALGPQIRVAFDHQPGVVAGGLQQFGMARRSASRMSGRPLCRAPKSSPAPVQPEILLGDANSPRSRAGWQAGRSGPAPPSVCASRENITADHILLGHGIVIAADRISKLQDDGLVLCRVYAHRRAFIQATSSAKLPVVAGHPRGDHACRCCSLFTERIRSPATHRGAERRTARPRC